MKKNKLKIKKGDMVKVIAGADRGKTAKVLEVNTKKYFVRVQGVALRTHFDQKEGIFQKEAMIDYSNVKLSKEKAPAKKA